jgi:hypothetical protein
LGECWQSFKGKGRLTFYYVLRTPFQVHYLVTGSVENFGGTACGPIRLQLTVRDHGEIIYQTTFAPNVKSIGPDTITDFSVPFTIPGYVSDFTYTVEVISQ